MWLHNDEDVYTNTVVKFWLCSLTDVGSIVSDHILVVVDTSKWDVLVWYGRYMEQPLKPKQRTVK